MKSILHTKPLTYIVLMILLILPFLVDDLSSIIDGFYAILVHPSLLISDYLRIGGLGASLDRKSVV